MFVPFVLVGATGFSEGPKASLAPNLGAFASGLLSPKTDLYKEATIVLGIPTLLSLAFAMQRL